MIIAFTFPGQGSQSVGMLNGYSDLPIIKQTFDEGSEILGYDCFELAKHGPVEQLNLTIHTQPIMLMAGIAVYRAWKSLGGGSPDYLAGHSLGEYTALVAAEALAFRDAIKLVRYRAEVMQECVPNGMGAMAAIIGLEDAAVKVICNQIVGDNEKVVLEPANFNSPGQIVIAGHKAAVLEGMALAKSKGAKLVTLLPLSIPSHCSLMYPAAEKFQKLLEQIDFYSPKIPVIHNADVQQHQQSNEIKKILMQQIHSPVHWVNTIQSFVSQGVTHIVECGPGKVLSGLTKRIDKTPTNYSLTDSESIQQAIEKLNQPAF
ncbi:MAG: ACP S-malonyltransferase [Nitrosomonas sp.]|nr:MAG: ACP S-malonyltransferase [Nitrosomonas sp.]